MPRRARMYFPGLPYHVVQRGNNREPCFIEPENYRFYLELWRTVSSRHGFGGFTLSPAFLSLFVALTIYHSAQLAEVVRAAILSVGK